jgi:hypothetical protein
MVELTKSEELDVAGKAAFCLACHALDSPVDRPTANRITCIARFFFLSST